MSVLRRRSIKTTECTSLVCIPAPTSSKDTKMLEHLGDREDKIYLTRREVAGQVEETDKVGSGRGNKSKEGSLIRNYKRRDLKQRKIEGKMNCLKKKEETVEEVLTEEEKDLWENSSRKSQVKDLN